MLRMGTAIQSRMSNEEGASLVEYALHVAMIAVEAIQAITTVGQKVDSNFTNVADNL